MAIIDQHGNVLSSTKPIQREIAVAGVNDRYRSYPSNGLTPKRLAQILREADSGDVYRQVELFEEMEEKDTHLFSQLQTRKNAVIGLDFDVMPYSDDEADKAVAEFVTEALDNLDDIEDIFIDLLDAIGKGFAVAEILWKVEGGKVYPADIVRREQKKFIWDDKDVFRVVTDAEPRGVELPENKFMIHNYKAKSGHPSRAGLLRIVCWMYLFKNYDVKDWVAFSEIYGMPLRLGKYNPSASEADKDALMQALVNIAADAAGIIPEGTDIQFTESGKTSSINVFESLANFCNAEMSKAILGQTLTSEVGSNGSYAASKTHGEVRQDLLEADCKALAKTFKKYLIRPLVMFNFGKVDRLPWIKFHYEPSEDQSQTADVYTKLVEMGLPISEEHVYERFGIPKPEGGQRVLTKVVPLAMKASAGGFIANSGDPVPGEDVARQYQKQIDALADVSTQKSAPLFDGMFRSAEALLGKVNSLEELKAQLDDPEAVLELLKGMDSAELEEQLQRSMFLADLLGRMKEDAEHTAG